MNFKADFIQVCCQFAADFIQRSFHLFCDVVISWSVSINRALLSPFFLFTACLYDLHLWFTSMSWRLNCWNPSLSAVLFSVVANPQYHGTVTSSSQASQASCRVSFLPYYSYAILFSPICAWKGKTYRQRVLGARAIIRNCRLSHERCEIPEKSLSFLRSFSNKSPKIQKLQFSTISVI